MPPFRCETQNPRRRIGRRLRHRSLAVARLLTLGMLAASLTAGAAAADTGASTDAASNTGAASLQRACFAASELAARPGEELPRRGDRRFDRPEPQRSLHAFAPVPRAARGAIRSVKLPPGQKLVALTLDLCEQPGEISGYDGRIFDYLRSQGVKATLFAGGKWLASHEARARQLMSDPLFEIANHAAAHRNLRLLSGQRLHEEIAAPQRAYEAIRARFAAEQCVAGATAEFGRIPPRMALFRFPYGACNQAALDAVNDAGLLAIQWNLSTGDPWPGQSAKAIARAVLQGVKPGAIIIGHANGRGHHMAAALPLFIPQMKALGYRFVTVSELLAAGTPEVAATCYNARPGDTDRYDNLLAALGRKGTGPGKGAGPDAPAWNAVVKPAGQRKPGARS